MSLKTNMMPLEEKIRLVERVAQNLRIGGRAGNLIAAENYEGLKAVLVDLQAQLPVARSDTIAEVERALDGVLRSKTGLGYDEGRMIQLAVTIIRRWPTIRPALEQFEKGKSMKPYAVDTDVPVARTKNNIEDELKKHGATSFVTGSLPEKAMVMFELSGRRVRFELPMKGNLTDKVLRSRWRALFLSIKAKLVSVATGIETFEEAFLAHVVLADGQSVYDAIKDGVEQQYVTGRVGPLLLE